jgi:D-ribose pyranose/furanose isomerase RbsD
MSSPNGHNAIVKAETDMMTDLLAGLDDASHVDLRESPSPQMSYLAATDCNLPVPSAAAVKLDDALTTHDPTVDQLLDGLGDEFGIESWDLSDLEEEDKAKIEQNDGNTSAEQKPLEVQALGATTTLNRNMDVDKNASPHGTNAVVKQEPDADTEEIKPPFTPTRQPADIDIDLDLADFDFDFAMSPSPQPPSAPIEPSRFPVLHPRVHSPGDGKPLYESTPWARCVVKRIDEDEEDKVHAPVLRWGWKDKVGDSTAWLSCTARDADLFEWMIAPRSCWSKLCERIMNTD